MRRAVLAAVSLLLFSSPVTHADCAIRGVVRVSERPAAGILVTELSSMRQATTGPDGTFVLPCPAKFPARLSARGLSFEVSAGEEITIDVPAGSIEETIVVTASGIREISTATAPSVAVVSSEELTASASPVIDDALRQVAGFTLFRRGGSRTANPTTQGASLRGIGGSGTSRAAILADGVPLTDPFGGWVAWGRVPPLAVEQIEVLRGGGSELYGNAAVSGVVHLLRRNPATSDSRAQLAAGSHDTFDAGLHLSRVFGEAFATLSAAFLDADGYIPVAAGSRGPIDTPAGVQSISAELATGMTRGSLSVTGRYSHYDEDRTNGTPFQVNASRIRQLSLAGSWTGARGALDARLYAGEGDYTQTFSGVSADRRSETPTRLQYVPSSDRGAALRWLGGSSVAILLGGDLRVVRGETRETALPSRAATVSGGAQTNSAGYAEVRWPWRRLTVTGGIRYDHWTNTDSRRVSSAIETRLPDRSEDAVSPRVSAIVEVSSALSVAASAYRGFRAPALNELHRSFRVGDVVTNANPGLTAETLEGYEAALMVNRPKVRARLTLFSMTLSDAVSNVTVSVSPSLITRRRENVGEVRSRGLELDAQWRFTRHFVTDLSYLATDAQIRSFPANPLLEGRRTPQVPEHQGSLRIGWEHPRVTADAVLRHSSSQFDDDQNTFRLEGFTTLDAVVSAPVGAGVHAYGAVENVFDEQVEAGRTPLLTVGQPRAFRIGLRYRR